MKKSCLMICTLITGIAGLCQNGKMVVNTFDTPLFTLFSPMSFQKNAVTSPTDTVPKLTKTATGNILTMTQENYCEGTSATFNNKFNPSKDWQLQFVYTINSAGGPVTNADGIAVSIHNDPRGVAAVGGSGLSVGCEGPSGINLRCNDVSSTAIKNSVDWEFRIYGTPSGTLVRINNTGAVTLVGTAVSLPFTLTSATPINIVMRYVASSNTLTVKVSSTLSSTTFTYTINYGTYVGTSAYLAFTGATGTFASSQSITKVFMLGYPL